MLEVGNGVLTPVEAQSHFSMWCLFAAPLIAGNDLSKMDKDTQDTLMNKEAIAVDQDPLGDGGHKVRDDGDLEIWSKQMSDGGRAVVLLNRSGGSQKMTVRWTELGYPESLSLKVRDLWKHSDEGQAAGRFSADVPSHGVAFLRLTP